MPDEQTAEAAKRIMVIFAHPDDAEFTVGGSVAVRAAQGSHVYYVVCTDGGKGDDTGQLSPEELTQRRQDEQRRAAQVLGVREVVFLGHPDGELVPGPVLKAELVRLIRAFRPQVLLTWDPWRHYQLHSDHRAAGQAALDAAMLAGSAARFPEAGDGLHPHKVDEVHLFGTDSPDMWVDISETLPLKMQAIGQHRSQVAGAIDGIERDVAEWNRQMGATAGFSYAEGFKVLRPHCKICR